LLAKPVQILVILLLAALVRFLLHRVIRRLAAGAAAGTVPGVLAKGHGSKLITPLLSERRKQRAETMSSVCRSGRCSRARGSSESPWASERSRSSRTSCPASS
jgi:small conductance mechanosensitive channel